VFDEDGVGETVRLAHVSQRTPGIKPGKGEHMVELLQVAGLSFVLGYLACTVNDDNRRNRQDAAFLQLLDKFEGMVRRLDESMPRMEDDE
jgi:hypothetical protein